VLALETIEACGIRPAALAGTSMGSIVGTLYASGLSGRDIHAALDAHVIARDDGWREIYRKKGNLIKWLSVVRPSWRTDGLLKADGFLRFLLDEIRAETFEDLEIPLQVVATDFYRAEAVVFSSGDLLPAIKASMAIPGIFVPVEHEGRVLVDGGVVNNVPYDLLQDECDVVIAIDVAPARDSEETATPNMVDAILGMFDALVEQVVAARRRDRPPTIYIRPALKGIRTLDFDRIQDVFRQARPAMDELRAALEELGFAGDVAEGKD
jgi:NTE family protein